MFSPFKISRLLKIPNLLLKFETSQLWTPPKGLGHFSVSALCGIHSLSSRLWLSNCTTVAGWSFHGTGISKTWDLLQQLGCIFTNSVSWALFWEKAHHTVTCLSGSPQPRPLHAFKTSTTGDSYTIPSLAISTKYNVGHVWNTAAVCWTSENTFQKTSPQWCQFLLNHH